MSKKKKVYEFALFIKEVLASYEDQQTSREEVLEELASQMRGSLKMYLCVRKVVRITIDEDGRYAMPSTKEVCRTIREFM